MEHGEVTPEFVDEAVRESISFHTETVMMTNDFYKEQIDNLSKFHKHMCDRFIEKQVPMLNIQFQALESACNALLHVWKLTLRTSDEVHCAELQYLRAQCIRPLTEEDCPITKFVTSTCYNEAWKVNHLQYVYQKVTDAVEAADVYREAERLVIQNRFNEHAQINDEWLMSMAGKHDEPERASGANYAIEKKEFDVLTQEHREQQLYHCLKDCRTDFLEFMEKGRSALFEVFETAAEKCTDFIDHSIFFENSGSSDFINEMKESGWSRIKHFESIARRYLERLGEKARISLNQARTLYISNLDEIFINEMTQKLDGLIGDLKIELIEKNESILLFRKEDRRKIRETHNRLIAENEKYLLRGTDSAYILDNATTVLNVDLSKYEGKLIGQGGEGSVYRYDLPGKIFNSTSKLKRVAVKKFDDSRSSSSTIVPDSPRGHEEVRALFKLQHPFVVPFLGLGTLKGERYLILEWCPRTLHGVIDENKRRKTFLKHLKFINWTVSIAFGLRHVHENGLFHGDLKPLNILLDSRGVVKIADFGLSDVPMTRGAPIKSTRGTVQYMAPEQHSGELIDLAGIKKCDVWAYGIVLWEMITCRTPFAGIPDHRLINIIGANNENSHPLLPRGDVCESLLNLLKQCWSSKSTYRPSFATITTSLLELDWQLPGDATFRPTRFDKIYDDKEWHEECQRWTTVTQ